MGLRAASREEADARESIRGANPGDPGRAIGCGIYTQGGAGYWNASSGVFNFYRTEGMSQAVTLQYTGLALPTAAPLELMFRMGNSDTVRKRLTVIVHNSTFDDLAACTFWLDPQQPLKDYAMRSHTTKAWTDATASFYAADVNASGSTGAYQLDDVSLTYRPAQSSVKTDCVDLLAPAAGCRPRPVLAQPRAERSASE